MDNADHAAAQAPLAGRVVCCTAIGAEQRDTLARWATEMGAAHKHDLTSDVTHLVVGHIETPKYRYVAKERPDVKAMAPKWLEAVRESWLDGGETDVERLEAEHRLPAFPGLRVCVTGFQDLSQRKYLEETVTANGASYQGDLTKAVTHLIATAPHGKKYDHARLWGVKVVTLEWLTHSLERGMVLDETLYDPLLPEEERGRGSWKKLPAETSLLGKRMRPDKSDDGEGRRKLRRTASTKLGSQSSAIWNDITTGSFGTKQEEDDSWQDIKSDGLVSNQVVPSMRRASIKRSTSMDRLDVGTRGCFDDRVTYVHGFDKVKTEILREHLQRNGAQLAITPEQLYTFADQELESGFLVTPSDTPRGEVADIPISAESMTRVNEWWVEKCIHQKQLVNPSHETICKPFPQIPISGFEDMIINSTCFTDYDRLHVSKVVKLMGATYQEYLKDNVSVLICSSTSTTNPKLKFCADHSIPAVSPSWLWSCIEMGVRRPVDEYLLELRADHSKDISEQNQPRKNSEAPAEDAKQGRPLMREQRSHDKLALSSNPRDPEPSKHGQDQSLKCNERPVSEARQPARPTRRSMPLYESGSEDEDAGPGADLSDDEPIPIPDLDGPSSPKPLHELSPSAANSPRKPLSVDTAGNTRKEPQQRSPVATTTSKSSPIAPPASFTGPNPTTNRTAAPVPLSAPPAPSAPSADSSATLNTTIAALLAQKKQHSSRPGSAGSAGPDGASRNRQRRRPLGRAPSVTSIASAASSTSNTNTNNNPASASAPGLLSHAAQGDHQRRASYEAERPASWADPPAPSQALVWAEGEGEAERENMIRRMGGRVDEGDGTMKAVQRIGRVRDVGDEAAGDGVGSRVGRRRLGRG